MRWFERNKDNVAPMGHATAISEIEAYWEGLRAGRLMPQRSEIDPRGILGALPNSFVLERIAPTVARIRVAGSSIGEIMGMDARGMPASCLIAPASRDTFGQILQDVLDHPASARVSMKSPAVFGKPQLRAQMLLLPLVSDDGEINRILGGLVTEGRIGNGPRRFELDGSVVRRLRNSDGAPPIKPRHVPAAVHEMSENPVSPFLQSLARSHVRMKDTKAPHLKLVITEDA